MTSYDTEEAAFALALLDSVEVVLNQVDALFVAMRALAERYRYTPFLERTHGQGAKLRSFGGRVLTWRAELKEAVDVVYEAAARCHHSRLSGAIGNYGGNLSPELEERALKILTLKPFLGATQIIPRVVYAPLAQALVLVAGVINKIALDIRLSARSGLPLCHEPFGKKQKGSSAMPHKKNTIKTEQMAGMERMARSKANALVEGIATWEGRAIEQSCVERVEWPDLFHVVMQMITTMTGVLKGLVVYPDHMLEEIIQARGTYASDEAKNFLARKLGERGVDAEVAYRIIQLASFCIFEPDELGQEMRKKPFGNIKEADVMLGRIRNLRRDYSQTLERIVRSGELRVVDELDASLEEVQAWNTLLLHDVFARTDAVAEFEQLFQPSYLLRNEDYLFDQVLR